MKNRISLLSLLFFALFVFSCEDNDQVKINEQATSELIAFSEDNFVLTLDDADINFEKFQWTAPDYGFQASVTYIVQASATDFSDATEVATVSNIEEATVKIGTLNQKLLNIGLEPDEAVDVKFRVVAKVVDNFSYVYSTVQTATITPYATSFPPIYGMGAGLNGWGPWPSAAVELPSSAPNVYENYMKITNGETFRFFAQQDWGPTSYNYPFFTTVDANFENANDGDSNLRFIGETGWYKVTVNLKLKTVASQSIAEPLLYMVGAGINGWNWNPGTPVKMTFKTPGVFEATTNFNNDSFRFFAQADWGPTSYNYPFFTTVDADFENANDGDSNLRFIGTAGTHTVKVDLNAKVVTLQ